MHQAVHRQIDAFQCVYLLFAPDRSGCVRCAAFCLLPPQPLSTAARSPCGCPRHLPVFARIRRPYHVIQHVEQSSGKVAGGVDAKELERLVLATWFGPDSFSSASPTTWKITPKCEMQPQREIGVSIGTDEYLRLIPAMWCEQIGTRRESGETGPPCSTHAAQASSGPTWFI